MPLQHDDVCLGSSEVVNCVYSRLICNGCNQEIVTHLFLQAKAKSHKKAEAKAHHWSGDAAAWSK